MNDEELIEAAVAARKAAEEEAGAAKRERERLERLETKRHRELLVATLLAGAMASEAFDSIGEKVGGAPNIHDGPNARALAVRHAREWVDDIMREQG